MQRVQVVRVRGKRARFTPLVITTALLSAGFLSLSTTGTLSGFAAAITNSTNTIGSGTLTMQEQSTAGGTTTTCTSTDGGSVSSNSATCSSINKFGGSTAAAPGYTQTTSVTIKNTGTVNAATFTLTPGASCTQSNNGASNGTATDLCAKLNLVVKQDGTQVFSGTLAGFAGSAAKSLTAVAAGGSSAFTFAVTLDSTAGNTYQGLAASVPMTWTFNS